MNNMPVGFIEHFDDDHDIEWWSRPENKPLLERVRFRYADKCEWLVRYRDWKEPYPYSEWRKDNIGNIGLRNWFGLTSLPSCEVWEQLESHAHPLPDGAIPDGIGPTALATEQMSEVLPFSQSEVRRIVEACGKSDIFR